MCSIIRVCSLIECVLLLYILVGGKTIHSRRRQDEDNRVKGIGFKL
jgi:hypothetical protein